MGSLDGKVALITGAALGQGAAAARLFADRGAKVMLCDVDDDEGSRVAADIGDSASYSHLDVTSEQDWKEAVTKTVDTFGKLDVLLNNAGIITPIAEIQDTSLATFKRLIDVNQVGVFLGMREVVAAMKEAGRGSIINVSSIDGLFGMHGAIGYCASKFAVRGMTKSAAIDLGKYGIRVNSIHPGGVKTRMLGTIGLDENIVEETFKKVPLGRVAEPREMAMLAAFLASDDSSYSTGSEFIADGGITAGITIGS